MSLGELEARLGVNIEPALLELALTHRSISAKTNQNNERLEFLGDAVLGLVVADLAFRKYPDFDERFLSQLTNQIVRESSLLKFAKEFDLDSHINSKGQALDGNTHVPSIQADAFEALIAAIYLTHGFIETYSFIERVVASSLNNPKELLEDSDPRQDLQKFLENARLPIPVYQIQESGPGHKKIYWASLEIQGQTFEGLGHKKTAAMKKAAVNALSSLSGKGSSEKIDQSDA